MDVEIHAVDTEKPASEGHNLAVRGATLEPAIKKFEGLPFGEHKDQHFIEVQASSWDGATQSKFLARLNATDLQRLFDFASAQGMIEVPVNRRIVDLVEQLCEAVSISKPLR